MSREIRGPRDHLPDHLESQQPYNEEQRAAPKRDALPHAPEVVLRAPADPEVEQHEGNYRHSDCDRNRADGLASPDHLLRWVPGHRRGALLPLRPTRVDSVGPALVGDFVWRRPQAVAATA